MNKQAGVKTNWLSTAVMAPIGLLQQTMNFKRLITLSNQTVDTRAKLDTMQKTAATQALQIGQARQNIVDTQEALTSLESELSSLTSEFGGLIEKR